MGLENPFEKIDARLSNIEQMLLDLKRPEPQPEPSDRCGMAEAMNITGLSKAAIYKLTHLKQLPHLKFGRRLVFSRRALTTWVEANTKAPDASPAINKMIKAAQKHEQK